MKVKEKMAEEYSEPFSADDEPMPWPDNQIKELERAYLAGFEEAKKLALVIPKDVALDIDEHNYDKTDLRFILDEEYNIACWEIELHLRKMGDEEAQE